VLVGWQDKLNLCRASVSGLIPGEDRAYKCALMRVTESEYSELTEGEYSELTAGEYY